MSETRRAPLPKRGIESKLRAFAKRKNIQPERLRNTLVVLVISQMVPEGTVIKGGNSMALTFPLETTRFSKDLDLVATEGFETWRESFSRNLEEGFDGFTGTLMQRGTLERHPHILGSVQMEAYDVKVRYLGKAFATLPLDITSAMDYERTDYELHQSSDSVELMRYLGFDLHAAAKILSPAAQLAQKTAAALSDPDPRPGDIRDMGLLFGSIDTHGGEHQYRTLLRQELDLRGVEQPYRVTQPGKLHEQFMEMGGDQAIFDTVMKRLDKEIDILDNTKDTKKSKRESQV